MTTTTISRPAESAPNNLFQRFFRLIRSALSAVTLEPAILLFCVAGGIYGIASEEVYIEKACRVNLSFNDTLCDDIQNNKDEQVMGTFHNYYKP